VVFFFPAAWRLVAYLVVLAAGFFDLLLAVFLFFFAGAFFAPLPFFLGEERGVSGMGISYVGVILPDVLGGDILFDDFGDLINGIGIAAASVASGIYTCSFVVAATRSGSGSLLLSLRPVASAAVFDAVALMLSTTSPSFSTSLETTDLSSALIGIPPQAMRRNAQRE
jgi:hypothetical protein